MKGGLAGIAAGLGGDGGPPMMTPERIVVATVFEARQPCVRETLTLYRTLAALGGELKHARKVAHCIGSLDRAALGELSSLGVAVRPADVVDARVPYANKLRMFLADYAGSDHLVALDNDVAVVGDITAWTGSASLLAKPAEADVLTLQQWERVYSHFGLAMPSTRYRTHLQARETVPYFNTGVLLLPVSLAGVLGAVWERYCRFLADALLERTGELPFVVPHPPLIDQMALALAVQHLELPCRELPLALNFPTHRRLHARFRPDDVQPLLLHHHHRIAVDGTLLPCAHAGANAAISLVNGTLDSLPGRWLTPMIDSALSLQRRADSGGTA